MALVKTEQVVSLYLDVENKKIIMITIITIMSYLWKVMYIVVIVSVLVLYHYQDGKALD